MMARALGRSAVALVVSFPLLAGCGGGGSGARPPASPAAEAPAKDDESPASGDDTKAGAPGDEAAAADGPSKIGAGDARTMDSIADLVKAHRKEARDCYEEARKQIPGLKGNLVIHFILKPNGTVKHAELNEERSTIREASLASCVIEVIRKIPFPRSSKGRESAVNYPFNFNP